jgi:hypothetical protein
MGASSTATGTSNTPVGTTSVKPKCTPPMLVQEAANGIISSNRYNWFNWCWCCFQQLSANHINCIALQVFSLKDHKWLDIFTGKSFKIRKYGPNFRDN